MLRYQSADVMRWSILIFIAILLLLISPALAIHASGYGSGRFLDVARSLSIGTAVFLAPIAFFRKNVRLYFRLLLPIVIVTVAICALASTRRMTL